MKDFVLAALPWIVLGLLLALFAAGVLGNKHKK